MKQLHFYCHDIHNNPFETPLQISLLLYVVDYRHIKINDWYIYPDWAYTLGVAITLSSVVMVPLWAAGQIVWTPGNCRKVNVHFFLNLINIFSLLSSFLWNNSCAAASFGSLPSWRTSVEKEEKWGGKPDDWVRRSCCKLATDGS